jgi:hypothetical protein
VASKGFHRRQSVQAMVSKMWDSIPKEAKARNVLPNLSTKQGPTKTMNTTSKDLNKNAS